MFKKRKRWQRYAEQIAREIEQETYDHWAARSDDLPDNFERNINGEELQIEIDMLEHKPEYIHLGVSVDNGGLFHACCPVSTSTIVYRDPDAARE